MRLAPVQIVLVPLGLFFSALLMMAGWGHTSVSETSTIMGSESAVQQWIDRETQINHCLPWSVDAETVQQDVIRTDPGKGHWFARLRCNRRTIYVQWAILIIAPWLIMNLVVLLFVRMIPGNTRDYDYFH